MKIPNLQKGLGDVDRIIMHAYENKWFWFAIAGAFCLFFLAVIGFIMQLLR